MGMVKVSVPGKVHLIGEHAVVYGEPAILTAIGKRSFVEAEKRDDGKIKIDDLTLDRHPEFSVQEALDLAKKLDELWKQGSEKKDFSECHDFFVSNYLQAIAGKSLQLLGVSGGVYLKINCEIPLGAGLGSSAAVAVGMPKAIAEVYGIELPKEKNNEMAYEIEKYAHGAPSGGDNSTCCFGGMIWFKKNMEGGPHTIQSLKEEIPYALENFVLVYTKKPELTTGQLVQKVMDLDPSFRDPIVKAMGKDAEEMREVLKRRDLSRMKELINRTQENLAKLGVSIPEIDKIHEAVKAIGGAAKGCGALGGGTVLCYHEDKEKLVQTIKELGFEPWETDLGVEGVKVEN